jgi:hypothetical protein
MGVAYERKKKERRIEAEIMYGMLRLQISARTSVI